VEQGFAGWFSNDHRIRLAGHACQARAHGTGQKLHELSFQRFDALCFLTGCSHVARAIHDSDHAFLIVENGRSDERLQTHEALPDVVVIKIKKKCAPFRLHLHEHAHAELPVVAALSRVAGHHVPRALVADNDQTSVETD
jgi:hypothetical protein